MVVVVVAAASVPTSATSMVSPGAAVPVTVTVCRWSAYWSAGAVTVSVVAAAVWVT